MIQLPPKVAEARHAALAAGFPLFDEDYCPPYQICPTLVSSEDDFYHIPWHNFNKAYGKWVVNGYDTFKLCNGVVWRIKNIASGIYLLSCYFDKEDAKQERDILNIRHFEIARESPDWKTPVLL